MRRLRHEVLGYVHRHGVDGLRVVLDNVRARRRMRDVLAREPIDALLEKTGGDTTRRTDVWPWDEALTAVRLADALAAYTTRPRPNCLDRAVGRTLLLRRLGWDATLVLGAPMNGGDAPCHAWAEVAGTPVLEADSSRYASLLRV